MEKREIPNLVKNKSECCGCAACYSICPVDAISMQADNKGFLYPHIDEQLCINCRKCINICAFRKSIEKH